MLIRSSNGSAKGRISDTVYNRLLDGRGMPGKWRPFITKDDVEFTVFEIVIADNSMFSIGNNDMKMYLVNGDMFFNE